MLHEKLECKCYRKKEENMRSFLNETKHESKINKQKTEGIN